MILSAKQFLDKLPGNGGPPAADRDYQTVSPGFLHQWAVEFEQWLRHYGVAEWHESFDCDNYSDLYRALPQIIMPRTGSAAQSLAIASIWYHRDDGGAHAINAAAMDSGGLVFIEPQPPSRMVRLSIQEYGSVFMRRI